MDIFHQPWRLVPNRIRGDGGREIDRFRGIEPARDTPDGSEAWVGSVTRAFNAPEGKPDWGCSETVLPDGRRMYLIEAIELDPTAALGVEHLARHGTGLGLLVKLLDAKRQYTLQAHPTRVVAKRLWDSVVGKEESWYVIGLREDVPEPPYLFLGFKAGATRDEFENRYRQGDLKAIERMCHRIPVQVGDAFHIGGGVPHALGAGCFVIEVQEPSDLTVVPLTQETLLRRMCPGVPDDRLPRVDEALYERRMLESFGFDGCDETENLRRLRIPPRLIREGDWGKESLLIGSGQTDYYSCTRADIHGSMMLKSTGAPRIAVVLEGQGAILHAGGAMPLKKADEVFLPHDVSRGVLTGDLSVVFCHPEGASSGRPDIGV